MTAKNGPGRIVEYRGERYMIVSMTPWNGKRWALNLDSGKLALLHFLKGSVYFTASEADSVDSIAAMGRGERLRGRQLVNYYGYIHVAECKSYPHYSGAQNLTASQRVRVAEAFAYGPNSSIGKYALRWSEDGEFGPQDHSLSCDCLNV